MILRKGYKYRLQTQPQTREKLGQFAGACRFVWNKVLALNEDRYQAGVPRLTYGDAAGALRLWKQSEAYGFLADVHSQVLQQSLKDLEQAYTNCFQGRAQPPTCRKKFLNDSFRFPQGCKVDGNRVYLPKIGWVSFWKSRDIEGAIKNVTVSRRGEHWFVSFQVEIEVEEPSHPSRAAVGIDMGIACFAALSDGERIKPLGAFRKHEAKLAREQQTLSAKVKFSIKVGVGSAPCWNTNNSGVVVRSLPCHLSTPRKDVPSAAMCRLKIVPLKPCSPVGSVAIRTMPTSMQPEIYSRPDWPRV